MQLFVRHSPAIFILMAGIISFYNFISTAQNPSSSYWAMKGNLHQHPFIDHTDSLSAQQIFELRDENGLPLWFCRDISKNVCLTSECRMVHLWLFWNSTGNYLGLQLHEKDPLTKTDHTPFNSDDYRKLSRILSDPGSILKDLKQEDLIIQPAPDDEKVDGHSGATQPSLKEYLIKDAAYTCYTLWHSVYGNTQKEIEKLLEMRTDSAYLQLLFNQKSPEELVWAINFIRTHPPYHSVFFRQIIKQIGSKNDILSQQALNYLSREQLTEQAIQKQLVPIFEEATYQRKFEILWKLSAVQHIDDHVILNLLTSFEEQKINASMLGYAYKLVRAENLENPLILEKLKTFLKHENLYVRNITQKLLPESGNK